MRALDAQCYRRAGDPVVLFFLLGVLARLAESDLRRTGLFLVAFGVVVPLPFAGAGAVVARRVGLSDGGTALLATMAASASYIAAPTAMRVSVPEANPALGKALVEDARRMGAVGYTIADVRGSGRSGAREGAWEADRSIEVKLICGADVAERLAERVPAFARITR